jgi:hypothetical protein
MVMPAGLAQDIAPRRGTKRKLVTVRDIDGRTRGAKRARQIAAELIASFGPQITKTQKQATMRAAMFCALAEDLAARRLAGQAVSLDELIRMEGVARRAVARLNLPKAGESAQGRGPLTLDALQRLK